MPLDTLFQFVNSQRVTATFCAQVVLASKHEKAAAVNLNSKHLVEVERLSDQRSRALSQNHNVSVTALPPGWSEW